MSLDQLQHAELATRLIKACGGVDAILKMKLVSVGRTQLFAYASPTERTTMSGEVMDKLEDYCGSRIYSGFMAQQEQNQAVQDLLSAVSETDFVASDLQRTLILALDPNSDGGRGLSPNERTELMRKLLNLSETVNAATRALNSEVTPING